MAVLNFDLISGWTYHDWVYYSVIGLVLLTVIITLQAIYNIFFHPLRDYPGPLLNRISPLPWALTLPTGSAPRKAHLLHEKYGPIVRLSPNHVSYTDVRAWKDIYGHRTGSTSFKSENPKTPIFYNAFGTDVPTILNADRDEHGRLRKALSNGFSDKSMREQEPIIARYVSLLIERLHGESKTGKEVNINQWFDWTTFDIIADLVFAESFGCLEFSRSHPFVQAVVSTVKQGSLMLSLSYLGFRHVTGKLLAFVGTNQLLHLRRLMSAKLKHRLTVKHDRFDLIDGLIKRHHQGTLDLEHLSANCGLVVAAGSETTASLLTGVTYLLLTNPDKMEKLKQEVRSTFASADEITMTSVNRLSYMLACLNEGLRMYPPAVSNLPRQVHEGGEVIAGKFVPEKTIVECQMYAMNYSSTNWHNADTFEPERFLHKFDTEGNYPESKDDPNEDVFEALQAFNVGPRNCIGRNLAYVEMRLVLARIIYDFDLALAERSKGWLENLKVYTIWQRVPLYIHLTPVNRGELCRGW
ncbi:cytochrome P450 [Podospora australis]|uniref:Cytochrome P450 n=1 Tax=Podospora australis TaxID=1536484 RepID=A0AAN6WSQ9_9PEZI|nr:cytochrome P450 [Podospora australis]